MDLGQITVHEPQLAALLEALSRPGSIVEVVAQPGMGKTTLLKIASGRYRQQFGGSVEYFVGGGGFAFGDAIDFIAQRFREAKGQSLLVIDEAEMLDASATFDAINRLSTGPWLFSTVLGTRLATGIGTRITLDRLTYREVEEITQASLGIEFPSGAVDQLLQATKGNPAFIRALVDRLRADASVTVDEVTGLLAPWEAPGLVGPDGRPLRAGSSAERKLITDVRFVDDDLVEQLARAPEAVYDLPDRRFEELVAELLTRRGYEVTLTPATRDGGKDMYAAKKDDLGSFLYLVECKRYAPDRPVGVGVVRALHGVAQHERANAAIVMTTSFFTKPAQEFARELRSLMSLKDYFQLRDWLLNTRT
jgi:restriction system protein